MRRDTRSANPLTCLAKYRHSRVAGIETEELNPDVSLDLCLRRSDGKTELVDGVCLYVVETVRRHVPFSDSVGRVICRLGQNFEHKFFRFNNLSSDWTQYTRITRLTNATNLVDSGVQTIELGIAVENSHRYWHALFHRNEGHGLSLVWWTLKPSHSFIVHE